MKAYTTTPTNPMIMSALEGPPSMPSAWQDPWAAAGGVIESAAAHVGNHHMPLHQGVNDYMNSSSSSTDSGNNNCKPLPPHSNANVVRRTVNFKLEIKQEHEEQQPQGVQKVPSISDLSDPESSLDLPAQVRPSSGNVQLSHPHMHMWQADRFHAKIDPFIKRPLM